MKKIALFTIPLIFCALVLLVPNAQAKDSFMDKVKKAIQVFITNDEAHPVPVKVVNLPTTGPTISPGISVAPVSPTPGIQQWEYWYQCHPNPANEQEIRGYLNDRGLEGMEVVAAAGVNGMVCEYYKRPKQ